MYNGARIILASQSPRRKQLLEQAHIPFEVRVVATAETFPDGMPLPAVPVHIALQKADAVRDICTPEDIILAADSVVIIDDLVIGKPKDRADAMQILSRLSGRAHEVITGVVIRQGSRQHTFSNTTTVHFKPLDADHLAFYVDHYKPYDKAGAYAIQEWIGAVGIDRIAGCFYNVMGLPVSEVVRVLEQW
ncbi:septum formation protein [Chitinophaga costaii]|uniref:dTTP/UTP pyrophosphatase n=1 Tax=Chitinophaga costaii TaxID=1335309 RepID=A0A1C3ZBH4_9BACT|nr:Maf family protein [Chitinophaga costaii]PUZ30304.1 septum formation protein Maf [Chitinophaga costaii]SCB79650.1 septum formation protein [Chitinophaga costaii]